MCVGSEKKIQHSMRAITVFEHRGVRSSVPAKREAGEGGPAKGFDGW